MKDLAPVMLVGTAPMAVVTNPGKPYKSFADVIRAAKAKPDAVTYGSIGSGSLGHLTMTLVQQAGGFKILHVPFKGGGPMTIDVLAGHVELGIGTVALLAPQVSGGKMRAIAVTGDKRSHAMPDVPTLAEQGFAGFSALAWRGVFAPAGTPKPIMDRFHAELNENAQSSRRAQAARRAARHGPLLEHARGVAEVSGGRDRALGQGCAPAQHPR